MPRNFSKYQYETSPRKLEPEYTPVKNPYKKKKTTARKVQTTNKNKVNEIKKRKMKVIKYKLGMKCKEFTYEVLKEFLENRFYFINNIRDFKNKYYKNNWQEIVIEKVSSVIDE